MADRVFLSLWLTPGGEFSLAPLAAALSALPPAAGPRVTALRVTPLDWAQPPLLDEPCPPGIESAAALATLGEYLHDDYAFEVEAAWELWQPAAPSAPGAVPGAATVPAWRQTASPVRVTLLGPLFDWENGDAAREQGDLAVDFGPEERFLAPGQPANPETRAKLQENAAALVRYSHALAAEVHPIRRQLWSEADEDLATRLTARLQWVQ